jgi:hypothetical protein
MYIINIDEIKKKIKKYLQENLNLFNRPAIWIISTQIFISSVRMIL